MTSIEKEEIYLEDELSFNKPPPLPPKKISQIDKIFEISLTYEQYQVIKTQLPKGFSLKEKKKKKKLSFSMATGTKKVHFETPKSSISKPPPPQQLPPLSLTTSIPLDSPSIIMSNLHLHLSPPQSSKPLKPSFSFQSHITSPKDPNNNDSILNERIPDNEFRKISQELKNFKGADETMKKCYKLLLILKIHPKAKPFLEPVDYIALKIPDYPQIVKEPIDLGSIEKNLLERKYATQADFIKDIEKTWNNSFLYNPKNTKIYATTLEMKDYFNRLLNESQIGRGEKSVIERKIDKIISGIENIYRKDYNNHNFFAVFKNKVKKIAGEPMNFQDKRKLMENLMKISKVEMSGVLEIINEGNFDKKPGNVDLRALSTEKLHMLEGYVDFIEKSKKQRNEDKDKKKLKNENNTRKTHEKDEKTSTNSSFITNSNVSDEEKDMV